MNQRADFQEGCLKIHDNLDSKEIALLSSEIGLCQVAQFVFEFSCPDLLGARLTGGYHHSQLKVMPWR